jgi:hypothetical protein
MGFFRVEQDSTRLGVWFPGDPVAKGGAVIDSREFNHGLPYMGPVPMQVPVKKAGRPSDFLFGPFDMPVVTVAVSNLVSRFTTRIERYPVTVASEAGFEILNVVDLVECFDFSRSVYTVWPEDDEFGHKAGSLRMVVELRLDERAVGHDLFRVAEWPIALVASERLKVALESAGAIGFEFTPLDQPVLRSET